MMNSSHITLYSIQSTYAIERIHSNQRYTPDFSQKYMYPERILSYDMLLSHYNKTFNTNYTGLIFGHQDPYEPCLSFDMKEHERCYVLKVPSEQCIHQDYYMFADSLFTEFTKKERIQCFHDSFETYENQLTQTVFPYIDESMIVEILTRDELIERGL